MYRGDGPTSTSALKRSGSRFAASTPIIALTECPTKMTSRELQLAADLEDVGGVAVERRVLRAIVGGNVGLPGADVVEEHHAMGVLERGGDQAPHVLIAPESVREHDRAVAAPENADVVSPRNVDMLTNRS